MKRYYLVLAFALALVLTGCKQRTESTNADNSKVLNNINENKNIGAAINTYNGKSAENTSEASLWDEHYNNSELAKYGHAFVYKGQVYKATYRGIEKYSSDDKFINKISDDTAWYINVANGKIYYSNLNYDGNKMSIYSMNLDGTNKIKLNDDDSQFVYVYKNYIFYRNDSDNGKLYRINIDGSNRIKLSDDIVGRINVDNDWIYYINCIKPYTTSEYLYGKIYKIGIDGQNKMGLDLKADLITLNNGWIYYYDSKGDGYLHKVKSDLGENIKITSDKVNDFFIGRENIIYGAYVQSKDNMIHYLYKIDLEGKNKIKLDQSQWDKENNLEKSFFEISIVGEWVYYSVGSEMDSSIYKIKIDGTGKTKL